MAIASDWKVGNWDYDGQRVQTSRYKMKKFWGSHIYCDEVANTVLPTLNKSAKRVDFKYS